MYILKSEIEHCACIMVHLMPVNVCKTHCNCTHHEARKDAFSIISLAPRSKMAMLRYLKRSCPPPNSSSSASTINPQEEEPASQAEIPGPLVPPAICGLKDICYYADKAIRPSLTDQVKYDLLTKHFRPCSEYQFLPRQEHGKQRRFQFGWLKRFPWLVYSVEANGGFCINCMLFGMGTADSDLGIFVSRPNTYFTKSTSEMMKHSDKQSHKAASVKTEDFLRVMKGEQANIHQMINRGLSDRVIANREKLVSIIKVIILCGRQNFALRGDKDSTTDVERDPGINHGNFWALMDFRVDAGDKVLANHLATAKHNATYTSGNIQNQLINVIGDHIRDQIIHQVKQSPLFSVIADEVTDSSNREQLSLVLRYIDSNGHIQEDFVDFMECDEGITGQAIADKILSSLQGYTLDLQLLRGQAYDGAGNMAGKTKGAASIITAKFPLALYLHCASHCLNLAVMKGTEITSVRNMMGTLERIAYYFDGHPKRQTALDHAIDLSAVESKKHKLKNVCRTRWVQRIEALETFTELYPAVVQCLETICDAGPQEWSTDSLTDARGLLLNITSTDFICSLVVVRNCLGYTKALTVSLQAEATDVVASTSEIQTVTATLHDARENIDELHADWFHDVERLCRSVGTEPNIPRRCGRQQHRSNLPSDNPQQFYKRSISIPLLDHMLHEFSTRFSSLHQNALQGLVIIPSVLVSLQPEDAKEKFCQFASMYQNDLPSPDTANAEFHCWIVKWRTQKAEHGMVSLPTRPATSLKHASKQLFPNMRALMVVLCVLPVTSCTSERSFSVLKRIKTPIRSSMVNSRLTGIALMHIHRDIPIDIKHVIDEFARRHPRKMELINILS